MENENLEFDVKPAGNKDLWLFLIVLDIIFLCVFGFFLYAGNGKCAHCGRVRSGCP